MKQRYLCNQQIVANSSAFSRFFRFVIGSATVAILLAAAAPGRAAADTVNYITNSTFENGSTAGWTVWNYDSNQSCEDSFAAQTTGSGCLTGTNPADGSYAAYASGSATSSSLESTVDANYMDQAFVVPDNITSAVLSWSDSGAWDLTGSGWYFFLALNIEPSIGQTIGTQEPISFSDTSSTMIGSQIWTPNTWNITSLLQGESGQTLYLLLSAGFLGPFSNGETGSYNAAFDDVTLDITTASSARAPEPSTWLLASVGIGGMYWFSRRRRSRHSNPGVRRRHLSFNIIPLLLLVSGSAFAGTIGLGVASFDNLIPDGATPGVNVFDIYNFTGATWDLPPDFPASDELSLDDVILTLEGDLGTQQFDLGDIGPGIFNPPPSIEFSDTIDFTSATLTATLSESLINLYDGSTFTPYSETVVATILPSSGNDLVAGTDFQVITASDQAPASATPEPSTASMIAFTALLSLAFSTRRLSLSAVANKWKPMFSAAAPARRTKLLTALTCAVTLFPLLLSAQTTAVTLSPSASPTSGQAGISPINLTGAGFPAGTIAPSAITVLLKPSAGGTAVTTAATAVTTIAGSTKRVTFTIPAAILVNSATAYSVSIAGTTTANTAFASSNTSSLTVNPGAQITSVTPSSGNPGQSFNVTVTGLNTTFVQGSTAVSFGADITTGSLTVSSPTSLSAALTIGTTAAPGTRTITATTGTQSASLVNGFTVSPSSSVSYTYDSQGRLATAVYATANGSVTVTYGYDNAGNRTAVVTQ
jgi:hypothetical protein